MRKILVTGGAGYIGSVLVRKLLMNGYTVRVFDKLLFGKKPIEELLTNESFELIEGDTTNLEAFPNLLDDIYAVIHLAALSNDPTSDLDPRETLKVNYEATKKLAQLCKERKIERFIFSSSCSVYGASETEKLTEESPKLPVSVYAETKLKSEVALASMMNDNFSPCFLRNATVFGLSPRMRFDLVINTMTMYALQNKKISVFGGGKQWRPLVHVDDVAEAFIKTLDAPIEKVKGQAFNIGSNDLNFQMDVLANKIKNCIPSIEVDFVQEDPDKRSYNVNFDRATNVLDFTAKKTSEEGIKEIVEAINSKKIENPQDSIYNNLKLMKEKIEEEKKTDFLPFSLPLIGKEEEDEVLDSLRSGWITTGPKTKLFEEKIKDYVGCKHVVALNSCTGALHLSLVALGIGPGDEVITSPVTWPSTVATIIHAGAKPVLVDINKDTLNIDPKKIEQKINPSTKAIIPVDMAGQPCELDEIIEIAKKHNLHVIEDSAHSLGAEYKGTKIGNKEGVTVSCFSFYPIKNITTIEGGAVATNSKELADKIKILSLHGISKDAWNRYTDKGSPHWQVIMPGFKYNMSDIQAALGIHQIKKLDSFIETRKNHYKMYEEAFKDLPEIVLPKKISEIKHARHLAIIMLDLEKLKISRDEFMQLLKEKGIGTGVHFISMHLQPYYKETFGFHEQDYPNAKHISDRIVSLPLYPKMTEKDVQRVISAVKQIISENRVPLGQQQFLNNNNIRN